jgi:hypothetical protein
MALFNSMNENIVPKDFWKVNWLIGWQVDKENLRNQ